MDILNFLVILLTGFGGLCAHWYNRYVQGRTNSTFLQYLSEYRQRTISSCLTILASEITLFQTTPPDLTLNALFTAFTYGYTLDSIINREKLPSDGQARDDSTVEDAQDPVPVEENIAIDIKPHPLPVRAKPKKTLQEIIDETRDH
jgi:hypothetical protein